MVRSGFIAHREGKWKISFHGFSYRETSSQGMDCFFIPEIPHSDTSSHLICIRCLECFTYLPLLHFAFSIHALIRIHESALFSNNIDHPNFPHLFSFCKLLICVS